MTSPNLPPNPWTISNTKPDHLDVSWLKYKSLRTHEVLILIENQLELLNRYDSYHRQTCPDREAAKEALNLRKSQLKP